MDYITIVASTYEEAVKKARSQYGDKLRIHSRKDVVTKGFLGIGKSKHCELTCFLANDMSSDKRVDSSYTTKDSTPKDNLTIDENDTEEADIKRFEQEAKTPDPVSGKYRDSDGVSNSKVSIYETVESSNPLSEEANEEVREEPASELGPSNSMELPFEQEAPLVEEKPVEDGKSKLEDFMQYARKLLYENDFSPSYIDWIVTDIKAQLEPALPAVPSQDEFELLVVDRIVSSVNIDHNSQMHPPKIFVLLGPTGVGKTTTIAKIAAVYGTIPPDGIRKQVSIISMDSFRVGAYEQIENFGNALGIPVYRADDETGFYEALERTQDSELILIDTIGRSPKDIEISTKMKSMLSLPNRQSMKYYLTVSASMKKADLDNVFDQFSNYGISSVIVTKIDETQTIGNILSVCHSKALPLLFVTDGQKVPHDIHKASSAFVLSLLKGFHMDFNSLWNTQIGSDE